MAIELVKKRAKINNKECTLPVIESNSKFLFNECELDNFIQNYTPEKESFINGKYYLYINFFCNARESILLKHGWKQEIKINENLFSYSGTGDDRILEIDFPTRKAKKHKQVKDDADLEL